MVYILTLSLSSEAISCLGGNAVSISNRSREDVTLQTFTSFRQIMGANPSIDFKTHLSEKVDPTMFHSAREFLPAYWAVESFSKTPVEIGVARDEEAIKSFLEAESLCIAVTPRLYSYTCDAASCSYEMSALIARIRRRLARCFGSISADEVMMRARWSSGASYGLRRTTSSPPQKWGLATHMTHGVTWWMQAWNSKFRDQAFRRCQLTDSNRLMTVPKNARTDRVIAAEPDWNMFFQLGLGASIRARLQKVGLLKSSWRDEDDSGESQIQQRRMAMIGSRDGTYATIDLKGASDSISLALCELLLPRRINNMVVSLRSPKGELPDGSSVVYEKVSSMGNGCTFELETAMFWAISCEAAGSEDVFVYGDDIIVPTATANAVLDALQWFGFLPNLSKTHITGLFRESCGGHYFGGADVTPPYFRKNLNCLTAIIAGYNSVVSRVATTAVSPVTAHELRDVLADLRRHVPKHGCSLAEHARREESPDSKGKDAG